MASLERRYAIFSERSNYALVSIMNAGNKLYTMKICTPHICLPFWDSYVSQDILSAQRYFDVTHFRTNHKIGMRYTLDKTDRYC